MKIKDGVITKGLSPIIIHELEGIEKECKYIEGEKYEMTVTSALDGKHGVKSLHYKGLAIDIRTRDMKKPVDCYKRIKDKLDKDFDVVLEKTHIHIEYDPK